MFERLTERARQAVVLAQDEARALGHNAIGTEHLLLGLLREEEGVAALVLRSLGVSVDPARTLIAQVVGRSSAAVSGEIPFTPRAKRVLELATREGVAAPEHLLLCLVDERDGVAARVLNELGAPPERVHAELLAVIGEPAGAEDEAEQVRAEKEAAIEAQDFHRAAVLRARERKLLREEVPDRPLPRGPVREPSSFALPLGMVVGAAVLGAGILIGWAIWG